MDESKEITNESKKSVAGTVKKILKLLLIIAVCCLIAVPVARMIILDTHPQAMKQYIWTEQTKEYYTADGESLKVYDFNVGQNFTSLGYFFTFFTRCTESADGEISQLQTTLRYNDSTLTKAADKLNVTLDEDEPFYYVLTTDGGGHYSPSVMLESEKLNLNYRRLVFENVDMTGIDGLYINIYANTDDITEEEIISSLYQREIKGGDGEAFTYVRIYYSDNINAEYDFSSSELKSLEEYPF